MMSQFKKISVLFLILVGFSACGEVVLLQELPQKDVNEITVVLARNGITVIKESVEKQQKVTWTLKVKKEDENLAREILLKNHLPREKSIGLSGVCEEAGMIPTPKVEKCREMLAMKGEIINSLESIPGVVNADVVLNIPDKEVFPDPNSIQKRPSASVVMGVIDAKTAEFLTEEKIQQLVASSVTGLDLRDVVVLISVSGITGVEDYAPGTTPVVASADKPQETKTQDSEAVTTNEETVVVAGLQMNASSAQKFKIAAAAFLGLFALISIGLIVTLLRLYSARRKVVASVARPALPERVNVDDVVEEARRAATV